MLMSVVQVHLRPPNKKPAARKLCGFFLVRIGQSLYLLFLLQPRTAMPLPRLLCCLALLLLTGMHASAQTPAVPVIGYVKTASGESFVVNGSDRAAAAIGMPLPEGTHLKTGANGSMGVLLKDNTSLSIGPNSELALRDFLYQPGQDNLHLGLSVLQGTLYYISGVIAKLRPQAVNITTPSGIIGVRGTQFLVYVDPEDVK